MIFIFKCSFTEVRETPQGKYEERLPYFSIIVPKTFKAKFPKAWSNLQTNSGRLTTPFDIHETISSLLNFNGGGMGNLKNRGISLFDEVSKWNSFLIGTVQLFDFHWLAASHFFLFQVPLLRSCQDSHIEPHWCTCLNWGRVSQDDPIVVKAADALVAFLNNLTRPHRSHCLELKLEEIMWVEKYAPSASELNLLTKLMKFEKDILLYVLMRLYFINYRRSN